MTFREGGGLYGKSNLDLHCCANKTRYLGNDFRPVSQELYKYTPSNLEFNARLKLHKTLEVRFNMVQKFIFPLTGDKNKV